MKFKLKDKINPGTIYLLDVASVLKYSSNWKIKVKRNDKKILKRAYSI